MFGNFYFLRVYLTKLKCVYTVRRPESHLPIHLPIFDSKNFQYSISFSIEHTILILILNVQYSIFNISNQYLILIRALPIKNNLQDISAIKHIQRFLANLPRHKKNSCVSLHVKPLIVSTL